MTLAIRIFALSIAFIGLVAASISSVDNPPTPSRQSATANPSVLAILP